MVNVAVVPDAVLKKKIAKIVVDHYPSGNTFRAFDEDGKEYRFDPSILEGADIVETVQKRKYPHISGIEMRWPQRGES